MPITDLGRIAIPNLPFRYRNRAVLDSAATITEKTTYVGLIRIANRTGTDATITITDNAGTPFEYYTAVNIPANSVAQERIALPLMFVDGIIITAGTADALTIEVFGWQGS